MGQQSKTVRSRCWGRQRLVLYTYPDASTMRYVYLVKPEHHNESYLPRRQGNSTLSSLARTLRHRQRGGLPGALRSTLWCPILPAFSSAVRRRTYSLDGLRPSHQELLFSLRPMSPPLVQDLRCSRVASFDITKRSQLPLIFQQHALLRSKLLQLVRFSCGSLENFVVGFTLLLRL